MRHDSLTENIRGLTSPARLFEVLRREQVVQSCRAVMAGVVTAARRHREPRSSGR